MRNPKRGTRLLIDNGYYLPSGESELELSNEEEEEDEVLTRLLDLLSIGFGAALFKPKIKQTRFGFYYGQFGF